MFLYKKKRIILLLILIFLLIGSFKLFHFSSSPVPYITTSENIVHTNTFRNGGFKNGYYIEPEIIENTLGIELKKTHSSYSVFTDDLNGQLHSLSTAEKCRVLARTTLLGDGPLEESTTDEALARNVERFRIYNYCFLKGNIKLTDILPDDSIIQLTTTLFPYMNTEILLNKESSNLIQKYDIMTKQEISIQFHYNHVNLFQSWVEKGNGKGIITTMAAKEFDFFLRLVKVLDKLDNRLPIQIVVTTQEDYTNFKRLLGVNLQHSKQDIQIINVSYILNEEFVKKKISGYLNKWIATLFNTFEESIFIDADVSHCRNTFFNLEPTTWESEMIGTKWLFDLEFSSSNSDFDGFSTEQSIHNSFFNDGIMHQIDSGVVIMRKTIENYSSLLLSLQLNMADVLNDCVHGDKEYFWLGPLISGNKYNIDPTSCGAVGSIYEETVENTNTKRIGICSTQIGHCDFNNSLLWLNGGAKLCKNPNAAMNDFERYPEFMTQRYKNVDHLSEIYNTRLFIDGVVIPDIQKESMQWMQTRECSQYRFCATIDIPKDNPNIASGNVIRFDQEEIASYNEISALWSEDISE
ncbi:hypothetical protein C6P45_005060 [Maudiozyma exigua]|uniref:Glycosyltransferase family 71 protein n=1 Tax=Maudiozyma exigua TaxID=34358 RepID=A0A9P6WG74_MAUEX|nr:hypothetical protein C6P45_005060 [Kazachstania exigua]